MAKAFASLHTAKPLHQSDSEAAYVGYNRVEIDWTPNFGREAATILFPAIEETLDAGACFVAIGPTEYGDGPLLQLVDLVPHIPLNRDFEPRVIFANIPEPLPESLSPAAKACWHLVNDRVLDPADLHPKIFEAINDEFAAVGLKVMQVTREGAAQMNVKMSQLQSLNLSADNLTAV